jgi:hypothetical protein
MPRDVNEAAVLRTDESPTSPGVPINDPYPINTKVMPEALKIA